MSELPDHDRIRDLLKRLARAQGESERIRDRIAMIKRSSPEFPDRRHASRLFADTDDPDTFRSPRDRGRSDDTTTD